MKKKPGKVKLSKHKKQKPKKIKKIFITVGNNRIYIGPDEYKGVTKFDIRQYYRNEDGEWCPTKTGIKIPLSSINEFPGAVQKAMKQLEALFPEDKKKKSKTHSEEEE